MLAGMIYVEKTIGIGREAVYAYHFPGQYAHNVAYPIKIGHAKRDPLKRIKEQQASMQDRPVVDLLIKCENSFSVEKVIHKRLSKCELYSSYGSEWFLTTPESILGIWWELQDIHDLPIGEQIRFFRSAKHLTQTALAKDAGTRQETISLIETGSRSSSFAMIDNVVKELGLRIVLTPD